MKKEANAISRVDYQGIIEKNFGEVNFNTEILLDGIDLILKSSMTCLF